MAGVEDPGEILDVLIVKTGMPPSSTRHTDSSCNLLLAKLVSLAPVPI
jgi:hypothetical protein